MARAGLTLCCALPPALHTSLLERIGNKIKVIKRMAYGFRDDDGLLLKIRAAFLPNWTKEPAVCLLACSSAASRQPLLVHAA